MPMYTYQCLNCNRRFTVRMSYAEYGTKPVHCPYCGSARVERRIGRVAFHRGSDIESLLDNPDALDDLEKDPRALGKMMRMMKDELGEDLGPEFDEVVSRLEKGQSPEEIEQALPELGDEAGADDAPSATADAGANEDEA